MKKLRYLYMSSSEDVHCSHRKWSFDKASQYYPNVLRYVDWFGYPLWSLPKTFQINNHVSFRMPNSRIVQLWEGGKTKVLTKLTILDLHHSRLRTLDLGLSPNRESLCLKRCYDLVEVSINVECLKLVSLDLNSTKLRTLELSLTSNLEE
ncbi:toll/interleukin-1 receptor (TIR) domain-containing protein [Artemisia annua]|uniref:Toll/interleukin-1 receptor (TIR) domain-containing protein n=1 Tax=Artemisia annua TaxID=35608 RepID=A0A2U1NIX7_ARTAN|nr:toll/interleukin-1 receptor (TIR) domain-containing protein [Artemisia annua]